MDLTEQERSQVEESKVLRDLLSLHRTLSSNIERSLFVWAATKKDLDERMARMHLRRLRCEDTPDAEALAYSTAALHVREGWEELNLWLGEMNLLTELFTRVVIDLRAGREPTVPHRMVTTVEMKFERAIAQFKERIEARPSAEGEEER